MLPFEKSRKLLGAALGLGFLMWLSDGAVIQPALTYNFKGYYAPTVLISPLREDIVYSPVGVGRITSGAGFRRHPVTGKHSFHSGVDLSAKLNDKVYNLLDGVVTRVGWRGNLGVAVEVYHPYPNIKTINGHLNAYSVLPGMWVQRGRVIGYAGSTGRSTGVHLHYTVIKADTGEYIEPLDYLKQVPGYLAALRSARAQQQMQYNLKNMKKPEEKPVDTDDEDLPDEGESEKESSK
jgi:murein DD-endopeptidase MepM/ murein hydrolase activator NlpD